MNTWIKTWGLALAIAPVPFSLMPAATAQITQVRQLSVERIPAEMAGRYATPVQIYPGRSSVIDFRTGEVITFIQLSDTSRLIYQTNAPLESGTAHTVVIRPIQPLVFDGATTSPVPNLIVSTLNAAGDERTYVFNLVPTRQFPAASDPNGVAIIADADWQAELEAQRQAARPRNLILTGLGIATVEDISRGLVVAMDEGYTRASDSIVYDVLEVLAQARNGAPLMDAAEAIGVDLSILVALGEIGIEAEQDDTSTTIQTPSEAAPPMPVSRLDVPQETVPLSMGDPLR